MDFHRRSPSKDHVWFENETSEKERFEKKTFEKETFVADDGIGGYRRKTRQRPLDITPKFVFGLTTGVSGNCLYQNHDVIVYPATGVIVIHDLNGRTQRYLPLTDERKITAMNLKHDMLAVATEGDADGPPMIYIYDLRTLSLQQAFAEPDDEDTDPEDDARRSDRRRRNDGRRCVARIEFLDDTLIAVLAVDGDDYTLYYYCWSTSQVHTFLHMDGPVVDMALNPTKPTTCCFVGKELFRTMTKIENKWERYGFHEANGIAFTCVCWLDGDRYLAGTTDGRVVVVNNGILLNSFHVRKSREMDLTSLRTESNRLSVITSSTEYGRPVEAVRICMSYLYGLVIVVGDANVYHFTKTDDKRYVRNCVYQKREYWFLRNSDDEVPLHRLESVCISPNYKSLAIITRCGQLYNCPLDSSQKYDDKSESAVEIDHLLVDDFHFGGVESLSTCVWKPWLMTCGKLDCSIKLWDFNKCTLLFTKQYLHQVCSVSIHPTGLYSVAAFFDHVEFQKIQTGDLVPMENFPILNCSTVAFSGSGHMFAVAHREKIDVYSTRLLDKRFSCKVHLGTIKMMMWSNQDMYIVAYNTFGAIFMFYAQTGKRMLDIPPYSGADYTGLAVTKDINRMYIINKDRVLREVYDRKVVREISFNQGPLNAISITKSESTLFVASQYGVVVVILLPMEFTVVQNEFKMHQNITKMCLTVDDSVLITCSEDGTMCMWKVEDTNKDESADDRVNMHAAQCDDALISMSELRQIDEKIPKTELAVSKLESEFSYITEQRIKSKKQEMEHKIISISRYFDFVEKHKIDLAVVHRDVISELHNDKVELKAKNERAFTRFHAKYFDLLLDKYKKYLQLENMAITRIKHLNTDVEEAQKNLDLEFREAIRSYEEKLKEKDEEILKPKVKLIIKKKYLQKLIGDTEVNVDKYVSKVRRELTAELENRKQSLLNARADEVKIKMDYEMFKKSTDELKFKTNFTENKVNSLNILNDQKSSRVSTLSKVLVQYRDDGQRKDEEILAIEGPEKRLESEIVMFKASIEELELIKQQLIKENKDERDLIENRDIVFNDMSLHEKRLGSYLVELNVTQEKAQVALNERKKILQDTIAVINKMKVDLHEIIKPYSNVHEKNRVVTQFFDKYLREKNRFGARVEFLWQIGEHTKSVIVRLDQMIKSFSKPQEPHQLMTRENMRLLGVIESLRKEAKMYFSKYNQLRHFLPLDGSGENK